MVERLRSTTRLATDTWRQVAKKLLSEIPTLMDDLKAPQVPPGSYTPGDEVEVRWNPLGGQDTWCPACVMSVHTDGSHVVRYHRGGGWGDTERSVVSERMRQSVSEQEP